MASIIEGYSYDIFISYRQKDNKYDGWVTQFVDNLNRELESAFKEEVHVYFDINPHDGLLETHDVAASLEEKLKCLVFIPIISRTYCDPKSYAWDHEFKAFLEQASQDQFGLKITLPNGNVANRLLPVRINDLDISDIKLCESLLGGVFRGVDFIYKEPGVNRPLRSNEDNPHDNLNHTIYRNQINKVALAVKDIIEGMKSLAIPDKPIEKENQRKERAEEKEINIDVPPGEEIIKPEPGLHNGKIKLEKGRRFQLSVKPGILILIIAGIIAIFSVTAILLNRHAKIKWAEEEALPEIERLSNEFKFAAAFSLVQKAEKYISDEPALKELASYVTRRLTVLTDPPGANIYIKEYTDPQGEWQYIGKTPIDSLKMPRLTFFLLRIEKQGYTNIIAVASAGNDTLSRKLFSEGTIPENMVYVEGYLDEVKNIFLKDSCGFFLDRYEVTNKQFKEFIDNGGYRKPDYWKNDFIRDGKRCSRDEAIALFIDKTGRPGPSAWEAGDYPEGQDDYPVGGVSWYEAAAYAEYAGKSLPTADHWDSGAGFYISSISETFGSRLYPLSNFSGKGPEPVGKNQGINCFGAFDMAGNVREWCWNGTDLGRIISGGGWSDATYLYSSWNQLPPYDRSPENGFRCAKYIDKGKIPETAFRLIKLGSGKDYSKELPVSDETFRIYKNQFLYDNTTLNTVIEEKDDSLDDWIIEKISFSAAYEDERMLIYLYLPRNGLPPYQTLIFFPGSYGVWEKNVKTSSYQKWLFDYILKSGRAVVYPVYKGTFERNDGMTIEMHGPSETHQYTERLVKWVKDFSRTIDYLETRPDIDTKKLGYYGHSWGGIIGGIIPAVEQRLAVNILIVGGFSPWGNALPEASAINYVPRIKIPTLMLNGRYDYRFPLETNLKPFFNLLGTTEKDKRLCIYETDHYVTKSDMIREVLGWMDKYLGPVEMRGK